MRRQNKILKILNNQSGMSLLFVLGVMMMLMAIGVSTLVAASSNFGFVQNQTTHNQAMILSDSIHKNILYGLQNDNDPDDNMSAQIVKAMCAANDPDFTLSLDATLGNGFDLTSGNVYVKSIVLSFPQQEIVTRPEVPALLDSDGEELISREPATATVNATMTATIEIVAKGKYMTSRAVYEYTGGGLDVDDINAISFLDDEYGEWRLLKHEKMDS